MLEYPRMCYRNPVSNVSPMAGMLVASGIDGILDHDGLGAAIKILGIPLTFSVGAAS